MEDHCDASGHLDKRTAVPHSQIEESGSRYEESVGAEEQGLNK